MITLHGFSKDKVPHVLSAMLHEAGLPPASGVFSYQGFEPDEPISEEQEQAIASYFAPYSLEEAKAETLAKLASSRWAEMSTPTTVTGCDALWFADKEALNDMHRASDDLAEAIQLGHLPSTTTLQWKTADGTFAELTLEDLITVRLLLSQRQQALYAQEATLAEQVAAATTLEELEGIAWEGAAV